MAFDLSSEYEVVTHGIYNESVKMKDVMKHVMCPECGEKERIIYGNNNDSKILDDELYFYSKSCRCDKCGCLFNFRISNLIRRPGYIHEILFKISLALTIIIVSIFGVLAVFKSHHVLFLAVAIIFLLAGIRVMYFIFDRAPEITPSVKDFDLEQDDLLRNDLDFEEDNIIYEKV